MTTTRRTVELDFETDARLRALAEPRGQEPARVISDALALLDSTELEGPTSKRTSGACASLSGREKAFPWKK